MRQNRFGLFEMKAIVWCEKSQIVAKALCEVGVDARSCDILPCEHPEWNIPHIQDDALNHLTGYDLAIGHPECTEMALSGVRWLHERPERFFELFKRAEFFNKLKKADIPKICLESPLHHKYARALVGMYDQLIQPYQFGDGFTKATCFWLKGLPPLVPTKIMTGRVPAVWKE
jgi:hypothetical protein